METIIGIGTAGCKVASLFENYNNIYDVYKIDSDNLEESPRNFLVEKKKTHEEYSMDNTNFSYFFKDIDTEVLVILSGGGQTSGVVPKVLERLVERMGAEKVNVLFIMPDVEELHGDDKLSNRLTYNVLMQWARSNMFNMLYLADNLKLEEIVNDTPVYNYYEKINQLLVSTIHMTNVFKHTDAVVASSFRNSDCSKIATFGIFDVENNDEKPFFSLDNILEKHYYYGINKQALETDGNLMSGIKNKMKEINSSGQRGSYGVYETSYEQNYGYSIFFSQKIQKDT